MDKRTFIKHVRSWDSEIVSNLLSEDQQLASYVDNLGKTPLHHCAGINAAAAGLKAIRSVQTARALVAAGADVNAVRVIIDDSEEFQATPLWYAIAWGKNFELARFLLTNGAHPDVNAVRSAIWDQNLELAKLLLSFGANIDTAIHNETPLLLTTKAKRFKLLEWLVANGANINFQDADGFAALHFAVKRNHNLGQIEHLLRLGADSQLPARNGVTPLSLATKAGKKKVVALFQQHRP